jgi:hypothetical protein
MNQREYEKNIRDAELFVEMLDQAWKGNEDARQALQNDGVDWQMMRPDPSTGPREKNPVGSEDVAEEVAEEDVDHPGGVMAVEDQGGIFN